MRFLPALIAGLVVGQGALAQAVDPAAPETILKALQDWGVAATLSTLDDGSPVIDFKMEGLDCSVYFQSCDWRKANCQSLTFAATFTLNDGYTVDQADEWNANNRFAGSYRRNDGTAAPVQDVNMFGGLSADSFRSTIDWWSRSLVAFKDHIDC
jgi:hypothetical protein